jgi:hypothetical protein
MIKYIDSTSDDFAQAPLEWQLAGRWQTASGYGQKITTIYKVPHNGRLYRVYATCFSNCASHWIMSKGEKLHVRD